MTRTTDILGMPDDARLLIVNADDFGLSHAGTAGIIDTLDVGTVQSTSLIVCAPWAGAALDWLRANPAASFAVHLTQICEYAQYRWGPMTSRDQVSSLVAADGCFPLIPTPRSLPDSVLIQEVEREFRAQIKKVLDTGLSPTHLDFHCLSDGGRADVGELSVRLAREYGLALRVHGSELAEVVTAAGLPCLDHPMHDVYSMDPAMKPGAFIDLLRALPAGLSEWAVHPARDTPELRALEPTSWPVRTTDHATFTNPAIGAAIAAEGVQLVSYGALQPFWRAP